MILRGRILLTKSGRSKQRGKWDSYELVPENKQEEEALQQVSRTTMIERDMLITDWDREIEDLRRLGKSLAVKRFREDIQRIRD